MGESDREHVIPRTSGQHLCLRGCRERVWSLVKEVLSLLPHFAGGPLGQRSGLAWDSRGSERQTRDPTPALGADLPPIGGINSSCLSHRNIPASATTCAHHSSPQEEAWKSLSRYHGLFSWWSWLPGDQAVTEGCVTAHSFALWIIIYS